MSTESEGTSIKRFLDGRPEVVVTDHGDPMGAAVYLDGKLFPVCGIGWECAPPRGRPFMKAMDEGLDESMGIPIVKLAFYARLTVLPPGAEPPAEKRPVPEFMTSGSPPGRLATLAEMEAAKDVRHVCDLWDALSAWLADFDVGFGDEDEVEGEIIQTQHGEDHDTKTAAVVRSARRAGPALLVPVELERERDEARAHLEAVVSAAQDVISRWSGKRDMQASIDALELAVKQADAELESPERTGG